MSVLLESPPVNDAAARSPSAPDSFEPNESTRMSFGDHLEELRTCLIRALIGVLIASAFGFMFGKSIVEFLIRPLLLVQRDQGLQPNLQALSPTEAFGAYLKIALLSGLILAMPWVLYQLWKFVASGLYARERKFVRVLIGASAGLFVVGVVFLYYLVLPVMLNFLISFNRNFDIAGLATTPQPIVASGTQVVPQQVSAASNGARIPVLTADPVSPKEGDVWVNSFTRRMVVKTESGVLSMPLEQGEVGKVIQSQFALHEYLSFVLLLALSFGIAFETPIVVYFLSWSGIVPASEMAAARRYVVLATVVVSAVLTPTSDLLSQLLLGVPIYVLFELGLFFAQMTDRKRRVAMGG